MYRTLCLLTVLVVAFGTLAAGELRLAPSPVGTGITYQGRLADDGLPANGAYDFEFKLYDALMAGAQTGSTLAVNDLAVVNGLFSTVLDFGDGPFDGQALYLQISVRPGASSGAYTSLSPRQALTAAPYALGLRFGALMQGDQSSFGLALVNNDITQGHGLAVRNAGAFVGPLSSNSSAAINAVSASVDQGCGVLGTSMTYSNGIGVAGLIQYAFGGGGVGVHGETRQQGYSTAGVRAVYGGEGGGTALEVRNGAIRTTGDHRTAFTHLTTSGNVVGHITRIDHPLLNGDEYALVFVTRLFTTGSAFHPHPVGVWYDSNVNRWTIFNEDMALMPEGVRFNVLIIKQEVFK